MLSDRGLAPWLALRQHRAAGEHQDTWEGNESAHCARLQAAPGNVPVSSVRRECLETKGHWVTSLRGVGLKFLGSLLLMVGSTARRLDPDSEGCVCPAQCFAALAGNDSAAWDGARCQEAMWFLLVYPCTFPSPASTHTTPLPPSTSL